MNWCERTENHDQHGFRDLLTGGVAWCAGFTKGVDRYQAPPPRSELLWLGVDLDGTLALGLWTPDNPTSEIGEPLWHNVEKLREATARGYKPIIHTSRPWTDYEAIEGWLNHHAIPFRQIQCGKPLYALYIDDRARHAEDPSWVPGQGPHDKKEI